MSRLLRFFFLSCAAALLAACQHTAPVQHSAATVPAAQIAQAAQSTHAAQPAQTAQPAQAAQTQTPAAVEFRLAQTGQATGLAELRLADGSIWVLPQPVLTRSDLSGVGPVKDEQGRAFVRFTFNESGAQKLATITERNAGNLLVLTVNGTLTALPRIGSAMTQGVLHIPVASPAQAISIARTVIGPVGATGKQ